MKKYLLVMVCLILFITGCSSETPKSDTSSIAKSEDIAAADNSTKDTTASALPKETKEEPKIEAENSKPKEPIETFLKASPKTPGSISIHPDPRVELLSIVQYLSGYGDMHKGRINDFDTAYMKNIKDYFSKYKNHHAVQYFKGANKRISADVPTGIVVNLSDPPALRQDAPFNDYILGRVKDKASSDRYIEELRSFAKDTKFMEFFDANKKNYSMFGESITKVINVKKYVEYVEKYFGTKQNSYNVIPAPLNGSVAFGPAAIFENGSRDIYCILPSVKASDGSINFGNEGGTKRFLVHEFSHSFVNPITDEKWGELSNYSSLMEAIKYKDLGGANYGNDWKTCVYEHIVRSVTLRILYKEIGKAAYDNEMSIQKERGFAFIGDLCNRLEEYENNRSKYASFAGFYPRIIDVFKELSQK